jgi:hypothetical protein
MSSSVRNCNVIVFAIVNLFFVLYGSDKKAVKVYGHKKGSPLAPETK